MNKFVYWLLPALACVYTPVLAATDNAMGNPGATLNQAKALYKQADELQGAWVSTQDLIKQAEAAMSKGDTATATKLANKAKKEAQASVDQAKDQLKNWSEPPYIRK